MLRGRESTNIEDRRGMGGKGIALGGGGCGTLLIIILALIFGVDPRQFLDTGTQPEAPPQTQTQQRPQQNNSQDDQRRFVASVLGSTEDAWREILPQQARVQYQDPRLVLFEGQVQSACGVAGSSTGPFYCPGDNKLYLDFAFFRELQTEFKAPGDFAQAYVIGHEVGHHVQNLLGTMDKVNRAGNTNALSVRLELQADCYAGVWANYAQKKGQLETGDVEEALRAASSVGDDTIQKRAQGYVVPESFTHGSSKERMQWFTRGFQSGNMRQCDTFATR
ncbi:MAG TPA: neutral zinc metallopeptidase [Pyrinomonadaceae bacterium]